MSGINGDKSRFNRIRKQKIARRNRKQEILKSISAEPKPNRLASGSTTKVVPA